MLILDFQETTLLKTKKKDLSEKLKFSFLPISKLSLLTYSKKLILQICKQTMENFIEEPVIQL